MLDEIIEKDFVVASSSFLPSFAPQYITMISSVVALLKPLQLLSIKSIPYRHVLEWLCEPWHVYDNVYVKLWLGWMGLHTFCHGCLHLYSLSLFLCRSKNSTLREKWLLSTWIRSSLITMRGSFFTITKYEHCSTKVSIWLTVDCTNNVIELVLSIIYFPTSNELIVHIIFLSN